MFFVFLFLFVAWMAVGCMMMMIHLRVPYPDEGVSWFKGLAKAYWCMFTWPLFLLRNKP